MRIGLIIFFFSFWIPKIISAQVLTARVLESSFDISEEEGEEIFIRQLNLNQDSLYMVLEAKVKNILNLESVTLEQSVPFIFIKRKDKNLTTLLISDIEKANKNPADIYLIFNLVLTPPGRSLIYPLVRNTIIFKVYIYDKGLNQIQKIKFRKRLTLGFFMSSKDFNSDDNGSEEHDLESFRPGRNEFLELFDKVIKSKKSDGKIRF